MAQNKLLSILVLLLLVFFQDMQCTVGRHLILDQKHKFQKVQTHGRILAREIGTFPDGKVNIQKSGSISWSNDRHSTAGGKQDFQLTKPGPSPGVGHAFLSSEPNP